MPIGSVNKIEVNRSGSGSSCVQATKCLENSLPLFVKALFQRQFIICKFVNQASPLTMKSLRFFTIAVSLTVLLSSCGMFSNMFKRKTGCPTNGKNVGAEKILSGDPKASKDAKKAKKFRS